MIPYVRHFCSLGAIIHFLFGELQMVFQSTIRPCFITTKTQDEIPQKSKMELIELIG